jgi:hypothetical protein
MTRGARADAGRPLNEREDERLVPLGARHGVVEEVEHTFADDCGSVLVERGEEQRSLLGK